MTSARLGSEIGAAVHRQHNHLGAEADTRIQVRDIFVGEADAAQGYMRADRLRRVGAVNDGGRLFTICDLGSDQCMVVRATEKDIARSRKQLEN